MPSNVCGSGVVAGGLAVVVVVGAVGPGGGVCWVSFIGSLIEGRFESVS